MVEMSILLDQNIAEGFFCLHAATFALTKPPEILLLRPSYAGILRILFEKYEEIHKFPSKTLDIPLQGMVYLPTPPKKTAEIFAP